MTADPSGMQEPEEAKFNFSPGQSVRIVEGPFTEFVGTVSESNREQKKVTVLLSCFWQSDTICLRLPPGRENRPLFNVDAKHRGCMRMEPFHHRFTKEAKEVQHGNAG